MDGRSSGFTLIEVMIALAIVAIALVLGAPEFGIWMQNTKVRNVAESVQNGLQTAHNEAVRRNRPAEFAVNADTSWTVTVKAVDANGQFYDDVVEKRSKDDGSSSSVTLAVTGGGTASFNGLGRVDNATPLTRVDVKSSVTGAKKMAVTVGAGGQIRLCDPSLDSVTTDDPRKCQ